MQYLIGDASVIIVAGSDTTAIALTFLLYHLTKYPHHVEKLRKELEGVNVHDNIALQPLPHLNAVINETLRLLPPGLTIGLRQTPPEGLRIGETFIPGVWGSWRVAIPEQMSLFLSVGIRIQT